MPDPGTAPIRFTSATAIEAEGARIGLVSCLTCGASILLDRRDETDPLGRHIAWHERTATGHA